MNSTKRIVSLPTHCDYDEFLCEIEKVRDCVEGAHKIKKETYKYLPHPSEIDKDSTQAQNRYTNYLNGAEFDEQPSDTLQTLLGKMRLHETNAELPDSISYLLEDTDGDGVSLASNIEQTVSNIIQVKFHIVVADYDGLFDLEIDQVSIAEKEQLNPRAVLKQYSRENVINWNFRRINGRMQLAYICLLERGEDFNADTATHTDTESYLILALDENGHYYQQKKVKGRKGLLEGEPSYVTINGENLQFIPLEIISDSESHSGQMPRGTGFLSKICNVALHKYNKSAQKDEFERMLSPTIFTKGWNQGDLELFESLNNRKHITTGGGQVNNLPNDVDYDVLSVTGAVEPFQWSLEYADKKILSMGGTAKQEVANMTATEADINASEQNAKLTTIADNVEACYERLASYCLMFEGGVSPDNVAQDNEDIMVSLPRDFATPKLSIDEVRTLMELYSLGAKSQEQLVRQLAQGGWDYQDAETTLLELEEAPPIQPTVSETQ